MNERNEVSTAFPDRYFPDRSPTWTEVGLAVLVIVGFAPRVLFDSLSWPAVIVGFVGFAAAIGPGANTALGRRIGQWFRRIGFAGRATVISLFAVIVGTARVESIPNDLLADVGVGGVFACVLFLVVYIARAGEISGWWTDRR
ncbi:hypothetical protein [Halostagnicola bangensis]